jgi:hypothetical protein
VVSTATMTKIVPIFVAAMILLVRVMIIGTFSLAGDRLFTTAERRSYSYNNPRPAQEQTYRPVQSQPIIRPASTLSRPAQSAQGNPSTFRPAPKTNTPQQTSFSRQEPTYHNIHGQNNTERTNDRSSYGP